MRKTIVLAYVAKEPEIREVGGNKVANITLADKDRGFTTKSGKVVEEHTEWINATVWGGLAEVVEKYVKKGDQLYLEGKSTTRTYESNGEKRNTTDLIVSELTLVGGNKELQTKEAPKSAPKNDDLPF